MLGEWAGAIAFPIPERGEWPRHGDGRYLRPDFAERTPPFLTWARPIFEQGALSPLSVFPADFPILCLPGDKLFQSKELSIGYSLPPIVHAFHGSKVGLGQQLRQWLNKGLQPLAVSLIGVDEAPPLWTHPTGCDFVRGSKLIAKPHVLQNKALPICRCCFFRVCGRRWKPPTTTMTIHLGPRLAILPLFFAVSMRASSSPVPQSSLCWKRCNGDWTLTPATQN